MADANLRPQIQTLNHSSESQSSRALTQAEPLESVVFGLNDATSKFRKQLLGLGMAEDAKATLGFSFTQQYLKGALDNMENARKAFQEKVKFIVTTSLGTFGLSAALASFAFTQFASVPMGCLFFLFAAAISWMSIQAFYSLARVLDATYDFYVAAIIHARIVLKSVDLYHPWTDYVDRAARAVDARFSDKHAADIRAMWRRNCGWIILISLPKHPSEYDRDQEILWSSRLMEKWKANPSTLLSNYQRLLGWSIVAHWLCVGVFILAGIFLPFNVGGLRGILTGEAPARIRTSNGPAATVQKPLPIPLQSHRVSPLPVRTNLNGLTNR